MEQIDDFMLKRTIQALLLRRHLQTIGSHCDVKGTEVYNTATTCPEMFWDCPVFLTQLSQPRDTRDSPGLSQVLVRENTHIPQNVVSQDTQDVLHARWDYPGLSWVFQDTWYLGIHGTPCLAELLGTILGMLQYLVPWGQSGTSWVCDTRASYVSRDVPSCPRTSRGSTGHPSKGKGGRLSDVIY